MVHCFFKLLSAHLSREVALFGLDETDSASCDEDESDFNEKNQKMF